MFGNRLIKSNNAGAACTTDTVQILGDTSCIAYYKMSDATDETGSYDGTASNVNFNVAGKFGNAGSFNGTSSKINTGYIQTGQIYSASFWGKGFSAGASVLRDTPAAGGANTFMDIATGANGQVIIGGNVALVPSYTPSTDWTHYAVVLDGTNATIYENGSQIATKTYTAKTGNNGTPVHMMSNGAYFAGFSGGYLDQVRIFNRAITSNEVTTLYNEVQCIPTIVPTDYFNTVLYQGDGTSSNPRTDVGFQPDFVWIKNRSTNQQNQVVFDSVRGVQRELRTDSTVIEQNFTTTIYSLKSFDNNGFTVGDNTAGNYNVNGAVGGTYSGAAQFVAWNWKAGGDAVSGTGTGAISSVSVSANQEAGFSVVKYSNSGAVGTYTHGLNSAPEVVIRKRTDSTSGWVFATTVIDGSYDYLLLNTTAGKTNYATAPPTSTVVTEGDVGAYISYNFHSVDGYSKIGSYFGTNAPGNSIVTGFEPAFLMTKRSSAAGGGWNIFDNKRGTDKRLYPNLSNAEGVDNPEIVTFNSNGFTFNTADSWNNGSYTYIFMAFANQF